MVKGKDLNNFSEYYKYYNFHHKQQVYTQSCRKVRSHMFNSAGVERQMLSDRAETKVESIMTFFPLLLSVLKLHCDCNFSGQIFIS